MINPEDTAKKIAELNSENEALRNQLKHYITLRKKTEARLSERERILQLFVEYAPASIAMFDNQMHYLACSKRFLIDYGIKDEKIIGKSHYDIFPEISEDWKNIHRRCLAGNIERREADPFPRLDGTLDWVRWEIHPWYSEQNVIGGIILFSEVITERKNAELEIKSSHEKFSVAAEELRRSYDLLNNLTEQVPGVVYQYRQYPDGRSAFPYSSRGMWDIYEVTPEEVREDASPVFTRLHPDDYDYIVETITESARNQTLYESEFRVVLPQQGERWRYCSAKPDLMPDGSTLWYGIITDITARKNIERELKLRNEELNTFFSCALDLLCIADTDGHFIRLNREWENVLGYPIQELEGSKFMNYIHPDDYESTFKAMDVLYEKRSITNFINRYRCKNGSYRWIEWKAYASEGMVYCAARDITLRIEAEEQLISAKEKAEESDRLKTAFLQNMSHEIRTPMNAIVGFAGLLPAQFNNKAKLEHFSDIINQRCNDLLDIINDILDIARIESGMVSLNTGICDIGLLFSELDDYYTDQKIKLNKQEIRLEMKVPEGLENLNIITDPIKLKQILTNLISNAFKFTDKGNIEAGFNVKNDKLLFCVADTGIGIAPDKHHMIFERFSQIEQAKSRLYGGTGLGLSIVKGLVKLLGGEVWLESSPGNGSKFIFTIDFKPFSGEALTEKNKSEEVEYDFTGKKLLIVEDDHFNTVLLSEILDNKGLELLYAESGSNSIKISKEQLPDLILMDIGLPDMSGYDAIRQIHSDNPSMLIIAQTAYAGHENMKTAISAGCIDYLSKPIDPGEMLKMVKKYLK